jgi:hypothetical protein
LAGSAHFTPVPASVVDWSRFSIYRSEVMC